MKYVLKIMTIVLITILSVNFTCDAKTLRSNKHFKKNKITKVETTSNDSVLGNPHEVLAQLFALETFNKVEYDNDYTSCYVFINDKSLYYDFESVARKLAICCGSYERFTISQSMSWISSSVIDLPDDMLEGAFTRFKVDKLTVSVTYGKFPTCACLKFTYEPEF